MSSPEATTTSAPTMTVDQRRGVETVGRSLLMSAAAGSGKTRVLAERCAYLVCDAPPPFRCDVDELLVVTFTEAAAAEMRERIGKALQARLVASPDPRLQRQIAILEQAQISTLHSFCAYLLRQHFHVAGLDPAFTVMDEHEARLLRLEVGREMLRERYRTDREGRFDALLDGYAEGDDERLLGEILRLHDLLGSMVDPHGWRAEAIERIDLAANGNLMESQLGVELVVMLRRQIVGVGRRCNAALAVLESLGGFDEYRKRVIEIRQICRMLYQMVDKEGVDAVAEVANETKFDKLKPVPSTVPDKDRAKNAVDGVMKEFKEGAWRTLLRFTEAEWQDGLKRVSPHVRELLALVERFGKWYKRKKEEYRQLDFSDLERFAFEVLRDGGGTTLAPSAVARHYHRAYKHVLVDEFQDINSLQAAILDLVSHEKSDATPNLFCVGDVKQSIYRFRLADPEQFIRREKTLRAQQAAGEPGEVIDLKQNFRSRGPLLEAINAVFARLMTEEAADIEYDDTQRLVPGRTFPDPGGAPVFPGSPIELHVLSQEKAVGDDAEAAADDDDGDAGWDRTEKEAAFVARRILEIVGRTGEPPKYVYDRSGPPRPARFGDIVILLRSKKYKANQFVRVMEGLGVPTHAESGSGFFESTEIRDLVALLCLLDNQQQDLEMAAYLRSPLARLPNPEDAMTSVRTAYRDAKFHDAVRLYAEDPARTDAAAVRLREILADLARLREQANRQPVHDTVWQILQQTGYLAYVSGLQGGRQRSANLMELYARARSFGTHRRQGLGRFLDYLKTLEAESDVGTPSVASEAQDVVRIMTVHGSKGLEFPIVIVPDCGKRINTRDEMGSILVDRQLGLGMAVADQKLFVRYPSLAQVLVRERIHRKLMAEELRVLYVALTRAGEHLILVGTADADAPVRWEATWANHDGPLPEATITGARTLLDWLGPIWAADWKAKPPTFALKRQSTDDLGDPRTRRRQAERTPEVAAICDRRPIAAATTPPSPGVAELTRRLDYVYPFDVRTREPAVRSVSSIAKGVGSRDARAWDATHREIDRDEAADGGIDGVPGSLDLPRFMLPAEHAAPAQVGAVVHLVLQHLRFADVKTPADVLAQADELTERHILTAAERSAFDADAAASVVWFLRETPVGKLVREHEPRLIREMPVLFTHPADAADDPHDLTMVRGRIDLFVPLPDGGAIVDFKTDDVRTQRAVDERTRSYATQVKLYAEGVGRVIGRPVTRTYLVFLRARRVEEA